MIFFKMYSAPIDGGGGGEEQTPPEQDSPEKVIADLKKSYEEKLKAKDAEYAANLRAILFEGEGESESESEPKANDNKKKQTAVERIAEKINKKFARL